MRPSRRLAAAAIAACLLGAPLSPAGAANPMGYRLLSPQQASSLPRRHGALGMDIERGQQVTDDGMTFEIVQIKQVRRNSPAAQAGFAVGDRIVAIDGLVFASLASFAGYVGSLAPGSRARFDYIPANGGPAQAQRVDVVIGGAGQAAPPQGGMSTREKIGLGAAALAGCYMLGCFSHRAPAASPQQGYPAQGQ